MHTIPIVPYMHAYTLEQLYQFNINLAETFQINQPIVQLVTNNIFIYYTSFTITNSMHTTSKCYDHNTKLMMLCTAAVAFIVQ